MATSDRRFAALAAAFLGWMFDGLEMGLFPLAARPALVELLGPGHEGAVIPWIVAITAAFLIGSACGGVLFGWVGDRFGRVKAMQASVLAYSVFAGLCAFARTPGELAGLRF